MSIPPPPVPPRPHSAAYNHHDNHDHYSSNSLPPPVPPLPPNFRPDYDYDYSDAGDAYQGPHLVDPLVAPRPQRLTPDVPADMARTLDEQAAYGGPRLQTPQPPPFPTYQQRQQQPQQPPQGVNYNMGFMVPGAQPFRGPSPAPPPPPGAGWSSPPLPTPHLPTFQDQQGGGGAGSGYPGRTQSLAASMAGMGIGNNSTGPGVGMRPGAGVAPRVQSMYATPANGVPSPPQQYSPPRQQQPPLPYPGQNQNQQQHQHQQSASSSSNGIGNGNGTPSLTAPLPTIASLQAALPAVQNPAGDPAGKVAWCRDVLSLVNRATAAAAQHTQPSPASPTSSSGGTGTDLPAGPARIADAALARLADACVPLLIALAPAAVASGTKLPAHAAEALYLRASLTAAGAFPALLPANPRAAFREFEAAARAGYSAAWFRLGRDYETFGDEPHARECFERGVKAGVESCIYRMGMAHLMGQLGLPASPQIAVPLLHRAATLASLAVPQPAYVYALLLLADFRHVSIPPALFAPLVPGGSTPQQEARRHLERAAYLGFAPAQYKLGHAYEFAAPPFPFDALLSVQYYSLASQQGEVEADMALSKWFLCGAEGAFEKDEALAFTFAEKAARRGLASAEFAMGYYWEVGIGTKRDVERAMGWYEKAAEHGNTDATERLNALSQSAAQALSRQEHDTLTEHKLVRTRTQAKQRSDATYSGAGGAPNGGVPAGRGAGRMDGRQVVDVIRRTSQLGQPQGRPYQPPQQQQQQQGPPPQQQQPPPQQQQHAATLPPQGPGGPGGPGGPNSVFAHRPRYSLSDAGPTPTEQGPGAGGRTHSPQGRPGFGRGGAAGGGRVASYGPGGQGGPGGSPPRPYGGSPMGEPAALPPSGGGSPAPGAGAGAKYNTFAEMGFQSQKLEEKDCVIM